MHTLTRNTLRDLLGDTIRLHRSEAPMDLADQILATLKVYAPKSFVEEHRELTEEDRYSKIAREMILSHSFDVGDWEIKAAYPNLSDAEVQVVDDLIGQAQVVVSF